jgi:tetratricopeptide (TPR) repeat protein
MPSTRYVALLVCLALPADGLRRTAQQPPALAGIGFGGAGAGAGEAGGRFESTRTAAAPPREAYSCASSVQPLACANQLYNDGLAALNQGHFQRSVGMYSAAAFLDPKDASSRLNLGVAWHQAGVPCKAIACFEDAVRLDPADAEG